MCIFLFYSLGQKIPVVNSTPMSLCLNKGPLRQANSIYKSARLQWYYNILSLLSTVNVTIVALLKGDKQSADQNFVVLP